MADKGAIVEFDFTALDGAAILFDLAKRYLEDLDGIALDVPREARYLVGCSYQEGLQRLFGVLKTKKTAAKAARELEGAFKVALAEHVAEGVTQGFRNFVKTLSDKGVKVVLSTRADICSDVVRTALADLVGGKVVLHQEPSVCYGCVKWDSWRLACLKNSLRNTSSVAVTGSGFGVKSALTVGMGALAVVHDHVSYQDFGGAEAVVNALDTAAAKKVLSILRIG